MITISTSDDVIYMKLPFELRHLAKCINGYKWDKGSSCWKYPLTPTIAKEIDTILRYNSSAYTSNDEFKLYIEHGKNIDLFNEIKTSENLEPIPITKTVPWKHQLRAYWYAYNMNACMLSMAMGTGKSKVIIDLIQNRGHKRVLIVCPKSVGDVWGRQFEQHFLKKVNYTIDILIDRQKPMTSISKAKKIKETSKFNNILSVIVINYHAFLSDDVYKVIKDDHFDLIIVDESHNMKATNGSIAKKICGLRSIIPKRICLTGTPMPHSPLDIYSQYRFLDPGIFGDSITRFKATYCIETTGNSGYSFVCAWRNLDDFNIKLNKIAFSVTNEVIDLPEYVEQIEYHYLSGDTLTQYGNIDNYFVALIKDDKIIEYEYLIVVMNKLRQLCNGFLIDDEKTVRVYDFGKLNLLLNVIGNIKKSDPIVIFYHFKADFLGITRRLDDVKIKYATIDNWADWQDGRDSSQCILIQIQAGGVGIDLTRAKYAIFFTLDYSLGNFEQAKARVHRPGQQKTVNYIYLLTKDSIEEKIYTALMNRKNFIEEITKYAPL